MIEDVKYYNENWKRIGFLNQYDYATYTDYYDDIGSFEMHAILTEENKIFIQNYNKDFYFQFNEKIFGRANSITYDPDGEFGKKIVIRGNLISDFFKRRVLTKQINSSQKTIDLISAVFYNEVSHSMDTNRNIRLAFGYENEALEGTVNVRYQRRWGDVFTAIQELLRRDKLGFDFFPTIGETTEDAKGNETNVSLFNFDIFVGKDRTKKNTEGNKAVVFSTDLGNLTDSTLQISSDYERNALYVAGEGEGADRKYILKRYQDTNKTLYGMKLKEEYIDARDIQKEVDGSILSDTEYNKLLIERADKKRGELKRTLSYEAEIVASGKRYLYGYNRDYYKGDKITLIDNILGLYVDTVVSGVTVTKQGTEQYLDLLFGDKKTTLLERMKING